MKARQSIHILMVGKVLFIILSLYCVLGQYGCSQVPEPSGYSYSKMHKLQSVAHWDVLAGDIAEQICTNVGAGQQERAAFYLIRKEGTFYNAFNRLLTAKMMSLAAKGQCLPVTVAPLQGIHVDIEAQVVRHRADRVSRPPLGLITLLGTGIRVARDVGESLIIPAALLIDLGLGSWDSLPHNEVVITTAVLDKDRYTYVRTDIYYINDSDTWQFLSPFEQTPSRVFLPVGTSEQ